MKAIDLTGMKFGRLTAISLTRKMNRRAYVCNCECGNQVISLSDQLTRGKAVSCGCFRKFAGFKHGMVNTREYTIWAGMVKRCTNPNNKKFHYYGGRGIKVSESWLSFENFYNDMGDSNGLTIERVDNDGNYCKENCIWADMKVQSANRRKPNRRTA